VTHGGLQSFIFTPIRRGRKTSDGCKLALFIYQNSTNPANFAAEEQDDLSKRLHYFPLTEEGEFNPESFWTLIGFHLLWVEIHMLQIIFFQTATTSSNRLTFDLPAVLNQIINLSINAC
jgi:hypothetical protein